MASSITTTSTASSSSSNLSSSGFPSSLRRSPLRPSSVPFPRKVRHFTIASSLNNSASHPNSDAFRFFKKSNLSTLIQEIEPLDVSLIQKDVPPTTVDAMKRTISGMLGLLPSDRFQVSIEALWEPLSKLLVSSVMTGYTLRNVEYRLSLERNLDIHQENNQMLPKRSEFNVQETLADSAETDGISRRDDVSCNSEATIGTASENIDIQGLGELTPEAQEYVLQLQSRLLSVEKGTGMFCYLCTKSGNGYSYVVQMAHRNSKELHEVKRKSAALQMQQFVGEEKNDLLDYLRSLQPEKVVELSEPTCTELRGTIHSVVHGLLATLSPKMHSKAPPSSESTSSGPVNVGSDDCAEILENASLQFQPLISLTRDYLARLLFWCMLLGHYLRGLEYRMQLMELLSLPSKDREDDAYGNEQIV